MTASAVLFRLQLLWTAALVASGVPLIWLYEPGSSALRIVHRMSSILFVWTAVAMLVATVAAALRRRPQQPRWVAALGLLVVGALASFTGYLLAWDQLALAAVTVGSDVRGVLDAAFSGEVRFLLFDDVEVSQGTYRAWTLVHLLAVPVVGLGGVWLYRRLRGRHPAVSV